MARKIPQMARTLMKALQFIFVKVFGFSTKYTLQRTRVPGYSFLY